MVVFDNAEDPAELADLLPSGPGHVLITSRNPRWHGLASPLDVDVLARRESVTLLRTRTPGLSEADAERLAEALDDLPLALVQAAEILTAMTVDSAGLSAVAGRSDSAEHSTFARSGPGSGRRVGCLRAAGSRALFSARMHRTGG
ncbi:hypothetical protein ACQEVG_00145 [Streptomyces sp. CA-135486]|uniref:hypothetical protein n=1 Tax=Streptomyces sp. CA-135486 TaxID=3240049 RepID=UPI003D8B321E